MNWIHDEVVLWNVDAVRLPLLRKYLVHDSLRCHEGVGLKLTL